jgi:uroporphyrinogen decarboxylase
MEMGELKNKYGNKVIFHGGVDNQHALPFGTVEEVRKETLNCLETLGKGREGFICCSCHNIQAGSPVENILAMIDTVKNW